jgi:uncharacterized membrane protein
MDATHLHLVLTHFPNVGTSIGVLILIYGLVLKKDDIKKVALLIFVLMSLISIPVFLTGEEAEETVEHLPGVSEQQIEAHEELAEQAIWLMGALGILSMVNFILISRKGHFAKNMTFLTLVLSLGTFVLFAKVGNEGGKIKHTEIMSSRINSKQIDDDHD